MKPHNFAAIALVLAACEKPPAPTPSTTSTTPPTTNTVAAPEPPSIKFLLGAFEAAAVPEAVGLGEGKIQHGLRFTDANGDNLAVFWTDADQGLWAKHVVVKDDAVEKILREVKQVRGDCEFDYSAEFVKRAIRATDVDADGFGEVTLGYKYACRSDMSPQEFKILVLENGEKSILRGSEVMIIQGQEPVGIGKFEPEGFDGSPKLLEHAQQTYKRNLTTNY